MHKRSSDHISDLFYSGPHERVHQWIIVPGCLVHARAELISVQVVRITADCVHTPASSTRPEDRGLLCLSDPLTSRPSFDSLVLTNTATPISRCTLLEAALGRDTREDLPDIEGKECAGAGQSHAGVSLGSNGWLGENSWRDKGNDVCFWLLELTG